MIKCICFDHAMSMFDNLWQVKMSVFKNVKFQLSTMQIYNFVYM